MAQQKRKPSPAGPPYLTWFCWLIIAGIVVAFPVVRWFLIVMGIITVVCCIAAVANRAAKRKNDKTAPKASPEDRLLADLLGEPDQKQGSKP